MRVRETYSRKLRGGGQITHSLTIRFDRFLLPSNIKLKDVDIEEAPVPSRLPFANGRGVLEDKAQTNKGRVTGVALFAPGRNMAAPAVLMQTAAVQLWSWRYNVLSYSHTSTVIYEFVIGSVRTRVIGPRVGGQIGQATVKPQSKYDTVSACPLPVSPSGLVPHFVLQYDPDVVVLMAGLDSRFYSLILSWFQPALGLDTWNCDPTHPSESTPVLQSIFNMNPAFLYLPLDGPFDSTYCASPQYATRSSSSLGHVSASLRRLPLRAQSNIYHLITFGHRIGVILRLPVYHSLSPRHT